MRKQAADVAASLPTQPNERIAIIDIVRAFALLGILVMNMAAFSEPLFRTARQEEAWPAWWDRSAVWIAFVFFSGKFNSLFSFLFARCTTCGAACNGCNAHHSAAAGLSETRMV